MLRAREIRQYGSVAKYPNLDLGRDQGSGRGEVIASFVRPTQDEKFECFTFVPDTLHNRVALIQRPGVELAEVEGDLRWRKLTWKDVEPYLAPAVEDGEPIAAIDGAPMTATSGKDVAEVGGETVISDLEDFLQLSKRDQLAAVKDEGFPEAKLAEILECTDSRLSEQARDAALRKAERLTGDRK